jgi:Cd2+/Zn2+-exporting ATPase/Cu+-exporting ATPase
VDAVILDKTGTLTLGTPEISGVRVYNGASSPDVMRVAATAERFSEHPLAKAIVKRAAEFSLPVGEPTAFRYFPGKGIMCKVDGQDTLVGTRALLEREGVAVTDAGSESDRSSEVMVATSGRALGSIRIADVLRSEASAAVREMKELGLRIVLLTGDRKGNRRGSGEGLRSRRGEVRAAADQKVTRVRQLRSQGKTGAMSGDGINDAPALMESNVGIVMGSGTDVARQSASVVLLGNDLSRFAGILKIVRRCRSIIMANFIGTLAVDSVGVGLAAFGLLNPVLAAWIHVSSELLFILNSARLLPSSARSAE